MAEIHSRYAWYESVQAGILEQGDILNQFEVVGHGKFDPNQGRYVAEILQLDVIVMTQSCDMGHGKARSIILCPVEPFSDFANAAASQGKSHWNSSSLRENLRRGNLPGYHLIAESQLPEISRPISIVDFHDIYSAPFEHVLDFTTKCGPRLRLCPPYKEHLAQAFARFFMRVGLPVEIPKDKLKLK